LPNGKKEASILGACAGAHYVRNVGTAYGIPILTHSDHCAKKLLPWFDGMLEADTEHFKLYGEPLFSSHMLDLSEEPHEENVSICAEYFKKMTPMKIILEMEIGITGGVEDGVDNSGVDNTKLYSTKEDTELVWTTLSPISPMFTIAAAFGNVHGVYKPGNVKLQPDLLDDFQKHLGPKMGYAKPFFFVFHGGSGSEKADIEKAVSYGVVKMNVDTDTQGPIGRACSSSTRRTRAICKARSATPRGKTSQTRVITTPGSGSARPRSRCVTASSKASRI